MSRQRQSGHHRKPSITGLLLAATVSLAAAGGAPADPGGGLAPSDQQARELGRRVWRNEAGGSVERLTWWNEGENFASLGIGHFIWYPPGGRGPFEESFPALLGFLRAHGVALPDWLNGTPPPACPWPDRRSFFDDFNQPRLVGLRDLLADTVSLQARFIARRLNQALPAILAAAPPGKREHVRRQLARLSGSTRGYYALLDYANFKGTGANPSERYAGQGWGLLQVLEHMPEDSAADPLPAFIAAASQVLTRRVANSPPQRDEARWLPGWLKRVKGY